MHRTVLDVDRDWWRTGLSGDLEPIAEFRDRLVAHVALVDPTGSAVATADSDEYIGSFGPVRDLHDPPPAPKETPR